MKKVFNSFILLFIVAAGWAATVNSVSVYTQRPADSEAVYFTSDNYRIKAAWAFLSPILPKIGSLE